MNRDELDRMGRLLLGYRYLGTFPLDMAPPLMKDAVIQHFIINTHTSNLEGQHWLAVTVCNNKAYIFDSFGQPPPSLLVKQLREQRVNKIYYNRRQIQQFGTYICGSLAIKHLVNADLCGRTGGIPYRKTSLHQRNMHTTPQWRGLRSSIC